MNELTKIKQRILERIETYIADIELAEEQELTEDEKTIFKSVKNIINEEFSEKVVHLNAEKEPRLSKSAFTVIDHVLKEHEEHEEHEDRFTTFCDGRHQQITTKQINAELDKLYNYFYGKGEESGEGTKRSFNNSKRI
jgi:hypothetical protein